MPPVPVVRPDGPKIRQIRLDQGLRVTSLARELQRHPDTLFNIERKSLMASEKLMAQLAARLGVKVGDITLPAEPQQREGAARLDEETAA
jgi:ribosome-binding protein aMBF1 (putative translation factor)